MATKITLPVSEALSKKGITENRWLMLDGVPEFIKLASEGSQNGREFQRRCTSSEDWMGRIDWSDCVNRVRNGDTSAVPASDAMLAMFEGYANMRTTKFKTVDDVAGGFPNVPAFVAGTPMAMRRRQRIASEQGPLTIVVDISSSSWCSADFLRRRGVATLALTRILAAGRPVKLYFCSCFDIDGNSSSSRYTGRNGGYVCPIDSAPLDLGRAAHILSHAGVSRGMGYQLLRTEYNSAISMPYGRSDGWDIWRDHGAKFWTELFGTEVLFIPPTVMEDKHATSGFASDAKAVAWLKQKLTEYGGEVLAA